ncbi:hypothetical protein Q0590_33615 [Rhodocytophaga aerolata]|uniref:CheC-like protein domain-containing protein n=1 Tax=Rhodocytophaga aerolata TaxID=455078 RepID=A0ABT8RGN5_9BACT|nr:hypothetical protein [Rhodocytophaga aerolata]MDO1451261.1 hypothetical protein [Rhodocytophaga aerolata]
MQKILTNYEFEVAKKLLHLALDNAAAAFSKMAMDQVLVKNFDIYILEKDSFAKTINPQSERSYFILTTEMKGDLSAKSYLIFDQLDISKINKLFLNQDTHSINGELTPLQQSILLELDNIISASMITQIANLLNVFVYGDVPYLDYLSKNDMLKIFHQDSLVHNPALSMQAKFQLSNTQIASSFLWFFTTDFLFSIKKLVNQKQHVSFI